MKYYDVTVTFCVGAENEHAANVWVEETLQNYLPSVEEMESEGLDSWRLPFFEGY